MMCLCAYLSHNPYIGCAEKVSILKRGARQLYYNIWSQKYTHTLTHLVDKKINMYVIVYR